MLLNLLTNACKYTDRGSIIVRLSVAVDSQENFEQRMGSFKLVHAQSLSMLSIPRDTPHMLLCEVLDTGIGISPDKIVIPALRSRPTNWLGMPLKRFKSAARELQTAAASRPYEPGTTPVPASVLVHCRQCKSRLVL
eukprot:gene24377-27572_t